MILHADLIKHCIEHGEINFGDSPIGLEGLEIILTILKARPDLHIKNAGGTMSLIELGAQLRAL